MFMMLALLTQVGCTTGKGLGEKDDIWYGDQVNLLGILTWSDVYYCSANKTSDGKSKPECHKAALKDDERVGPLRLKPRE